MPDLSPGEKFYRSLVNIVGKDNAQLYLRKFRPLDSRQHDNLLKYEALAFYVYTTGLNWHQIINEQLWSGRPSTDVREFEKVLNNALAKLPLYRARNGVVYRGYRATDLNEVSEKYLIGDNVTFPGFTSASHLESEAFGGNILFVIKSLTARPLWYLSANFGEYEVLIPSRKTFRIIDLVKKPEKIAIFLEELP